MTPQDCSEKLNTIYRTYYPAPTGTPCVNILNATLTETDPALCPSNSSAIACFNVRSSAPALWTPHRLASHLGLNCAHLYHASPGRLAEADLCTL